MKVDDFMCWVGPNTDNVYLLADSPPKGVHPSRWVAMVRWLITRCKYRDGIRL